MMKVGRNEIKGLFAEECNRIFSNQNEKEVQTQNVQALVNMLQIGKNAVVKEVQTRSARFLQTIMIEFFSRKAADEVMS